MDKSADESRISSDDKNIESILGKKSQGLFQSELKPEILFECTVCQEKFMKEIDLTKHYRDHMKKNLFMCISDEECEDSFDKSKFAQNLKKSIECDISTSIGQVNPYKCDTCHEVFLFKNSLKKHYSVHTKINLINSEKDYETVTDELSFSLHMQQNIKSGISSSGNQSSAFECDVCHKIFSHKSSLTRHYSIHGEINLLESNIPGNKYTCPLCDKSFLLDEQLRRHHRCHIKPYECNVCHKTFAFKSNLITHHQTHIDKNSYMCSVCFKSFGCRQDLQCHIVTHTEIQPIYSLLQNNIKPFYSLMQNINSDDTLSTKTIEMSPPKSENISDYNKIDKLFHCHICGKSFDSSSKLSIHFAIHKQEKRHICIVCLKSFSKISHLQCHLRIHTGEKPFSCSVCGRAFSEKSNLIKHESRHQRDFLRKATF